MSNKIDKDVQEASAVFAELSTEIYYSLNMKMVMIDNPELLAWAKHLANKCKEARNAVTIEKLLKEEK